VATFTSTPYQQQRQPSRASRVRGSISRAANPKHSHLGTNSRVTAARPAAQSNQEPDRLAVKLLPLVKSVAYQMLDHLPQHADLDDLAGAGVIGLLCAVRKFDSRRRVKIETYARHRIRGAILDSLRKMDFVSRDVRRKCKDAEKTYMRLQAALGRSVSDEEMAHALGVSLKKWYRTVRVLKVADMAWMRPNLIPEANLYEEKAAPGERDNPFDLCYRAEQRAILHLATASLPARERTVLALRYGRDMTMKEAGERMGVKESRVSQIHKAAITHLRDNVTKLLRPASQARPHRARSEFSAESLKKIKTNPGWSSTIKHLTQPARA